MYKKYRMCKQCVMDITDPEIFFDDEGICNHCRRYELLKNSYPHNLNEKEKKRELQKIIEKMIIEKMKNSGKNKKYDCVIGVSGGVDSTYLAYLTKKFGLRPLAVHLDNGWNSELAVNNIEKCLRALGIDLETIVLNWEEFKDLQLAFLKASVPDVEIPTDHAIIASLYKVASKYNIKYIVLGVNFSTESVLPRMWSHGHNDWKYIKVFTGSLGIKKS